MPIRLSELVNDLRWVQISYAEQELNIGYRPNAVNIESMAILESLSQGNIEELANLLPILIAEWDLLEDDGSMVPPTVATFRRLSFPLMQLITETITAGIASDSEKKAPNGTYAAGSQRAGKSANVPTGIPSSAPRDTWA